MLFHHALHDLAQSASATWQTYAAATSDPAAYQKVCSAAKHPPSPPQSESYSGSTSDSEPDHKSDADFSAVIDRALSFLDRPQLFRQAVEPSL